MSTKIKIGIIVFEILLLAFFGVAGFRYFSGKDISDDSDTGNEMQVDTKENIKSDIESTEQEFPEQETWELHAEDSEFDGMKSSTEAETESDIDISDMTLEEKVAQMFVITPEALTGYETVIQAGEVT